MKLRLALVLLSVAALAGAGFAYSAHTRSSSLVATVFGGGHHGPECTVDYTPGNQLCFNTVGRDFSIEATGLGVGTGRATGTVLYGSRDAGTPSITLDVHCLRVVGSAAVVAGLITASPDNPSIVGMAGAIYVNDRSGPSGSPVDEVSPFHTVDLTQPFPQFPGEPARFPNVCPTDVTPPYGTGYFEFQGDVSVRG